MSKEIKFELKNILFHKVEGISMLAGFNKIWTPEMRPIIPISGRIVVKTIAAVSSVTIVYTVEFEEIGS